MCIRDSVFYCFYKITFSKNYNENTKKFILLIKTYLSTTLIWQRHFSTNQSKLPFENLVIGDVACLQLLYLYVTQPCLHTLTQARLSANQNARSILRTLLKAVNIPIKYLPFPPFISWLQGFLNTIQKKKRKKKGVSDIYCFLRFSGDFSGDFRVIFAHIKIRLNQN